MEESVGRTRAGARHSARENPHPVLRRNGRMAGRAGNGTGVDDVMQMAGTGNPSTTTTATAVAVPGSAAMTNVGVEAVSGAFAAAAAAGTCGAGSNGGGARAPRIAGAMARVGASGKNEKRESHARAANSRLKGHKRKLADALLGGGGGGGTGNVGSSTPAALAAAALKEKLTDNTIEVTVQNFINAKANLEYCRWTVLKKNAPTSAAVDADRCIVESLLHPAGTCDAGDDREEMTTDALSRHVIEDMLQLRKWAHGIAELAKNEDNVNGIVKCGTIDYVVPLLNFECTESTAKEIKAHAADIEKEACFILGLLAIKSEHQKAIANAGAIPHLVNLLSRHAVDLRPGYDGANGSETTPARGAGSGSGATSSGAIASGDTTTGVGGADGGDRERVSEASKPKFGNPSVARRAADTITNLAHENIGIKVQVRVEGGIPPLVALLHSADCKAQRAAASALRTLAFKNEENKNEIVECDALQTLIFMLRSEDTSIHYEAVGVIGNLVHSSRNIKKRVLQEGALQPVIGLLSSPCGESQREAALLLGQFATSEENRRSIVQRGAVAPLINMLEKSDGQLKEMAAFALGRLAQNPDNQAGICSQGGLRPLLELLESRNGNLQHNAAFALYGLADNEDNVADIVCAGGVQLLLDGNLIVQASKDCVVKTLKRLEDKVQGRVLSQLLFLLHNNVQKQQMKRCIATALAHLVSVEDLKTVFVDNTALDVLTTMLLSNQPHHQREAAMALTALGTKSNAGKFLDVSPPSATAQQAVYIGGDHVNSRILSDVTFEVEGKLFYGHRIALLASSDAFRAMFHGVYKEKDAEVIAIPNISYRVFEAMMTCIYTGTVVVEPEIARDLLQAADQYLLDGLKRLCEEAIAEELSHENIMHIYELAETYHAPHLINSTILFTLENYRGVLENTDHTEYQSFTSFTTAIERMMPELRALFVNSITQAVDNHAKDASDIFHIGSEVTA